MKQKLRAAALQKRNAMPPNLRQENSRRMAAILLQSERYRQAERIFTFVSMGSEIETREIMTQAWRDGKTVAVPKTEKGRVMVFLPIASLADLREGRFGVMEPAGEKAQEIVPQAGDLFLVPGALFDEKKHRLGYGGGYYDTYFAKHGGFEKIGLAFSIQIQKEPLPVEETDIPLDEIVTENGWMGGKNHG